MNDSILTIPHDFEAEQAILGSIIFNNNFINEVIGILSPNSFHSKHHQHIFRAILELSETNQPIDEISLGNQLKKYGKLEEIGNYGYLAELVVFVPPTINIPYWAKTVAENAMLRDLISIASDISRKARDPQQSINSLLIEAENKIQEIASNSIQKHTKKLGDVLQEVYKDLEKASKTPDKDIGLMSGFEELDDLTDGFMPGDLIIIAARPGHGKSTIALNIANYISHQYKKTVMLFSREMQMKKLAKRALMSDGKINYRFLKTGKGEQEDWDKLSKSANKLSDCNIYLNDKTKQIDEIIFESKNQNKKLGGVDLFIFDYLQKIVGCGQRIREQEISDISAKLKDLAMDLDVPVIALAQLSRALEKRPDKHPILSDLRESGAIEQDADIILFIYRDELYNEKSDKKGMADIEAAKVRDGPTGMIELIFSGKYTKFENVPKFQQL